MAIVRDNSLLIEVIREILDEMSGRETRIIYNRKVYKHPKGNYRIEGDSLTCRSSQEAAEILASFEKMA